MGIDAGEKIEYAIMGRIHGELEDLPTLYFYDFVDFQHVSDSFRNIALKNIEVL